MQTEMRINGQRVTMLFCSKLNVYSFLIFVELAKVFSKPRK